MKVKKIQQKAFTLIEVLIALVIIAIGLAASARSVNESIRTTTHVRNTIAAHWVGMNILSEIKTGLIQAPSVGNAINGKTKMMNQEWEWRARIDADEVMRHVNRITVTVGVRHRVINTVVGYQIGASVD